MVDSNCSAFTFQMLKQRYWKTVVWFNKYLQDPWEPKNVVESHFCCAYFDFKCISPDYYFFLFLMFGISSCIFVLLSCYKLLFQITCFSFDLTNFNLGSGMVPLTQISQGKMLLAVLTLLPEVELNSLLLLDPTTSYAEQLWHWATHAHSWGLGESFQDTTEHC